MQIMWITYPDNVLIFLLDGRRKISHHSLNIVEKVRDLAYKIVEKVCDLAYKSTVYIFHQYDTSVSHISIIPLLILLISILVL
jgi:hypothetical protein